MEERNEGCERHRYAVCEVCAYERGVKSEHDRCVRIIRMWGEKRDTSWTEDIVEAIEPDNIGKANDRQNEFLRNYKGDE